MTAYQFNFTNAQEGMLADSSLRRVDSSVAIVPGNIIGFGKAVSVGDFAGTFELVALPYDNTREVFGVTVYTPVNFDGVYNISDRCSILSFGRIFVKNNTFFPAYPGYAAYIDNNPVGGTMGNFTVLAAYGPNPGENNRRVGTFLSSVPANGGIGVLDFAPWLN
jgi:hypothetical protein